MFSSKFARLLTLSSLVAGGASATAKEIKLCAGQPGTAYYQAAQIFKQKVESLSKDTTILVGQSNGSMDNVTRLLEIQSDDEATCDLGFVRSDTNYFQAGQVNEDVIYKKELITISDNTGVAGDSGLASDDAFHEYVQLLCNRELSISKEVEANGDQSQVYDIGDLVELAKAQKTELDGLKYKLGKHNLKTADYKGSDKTTALQQAKKMQMDINRILRDQVTIFFVNEDVAGYSPDVRKDQICNNPTGSLVTWCNFVKEDDDQWLFSADYANINVQIIEGAKEKTAGEVALAKVLSRKNACFLNVDRVGGVMKTANDNHAEKLRLVEMNDGAFNNLKIGDDRIYNFVDLEAKSVYPRLRAKRPNGVFGSGMFTGRRTVGTLAVRTQLQTTTEFYEKNLNTDSSADLLNAMEEGLRAVKVQMLDQADH